MLGRGGTRSLRVTWKKEQSRAREKYRSPGRAGHDIVPARAQRQRVAPRTMSCRATLAVERFGASVPVRREAAGAPSARSQPLNQPSRDRAVGATLGRRRRPRRPVVDGTRSASSVRVSGPRPRPEPGLLEAMEQTARWTAVSPCDGAMVRWCDYPASSIEYLASSFYNAPHES